MSIQSTGLSDHERTGAHKPDPLADYYTEAEAARALKKSKRQIARYRAKRQLAYTVVGKTIYISPEHVRAMLHKNEVGPIRRRRG